MLSPVSTFVPSLGLVPRQRIGRTYGVPPSACTKLDLLPAERNPFLLLSPAPTTVTFFRGNAARVRPQLEQRISEVLKSNPWLGTYLQGGSAYCPSRTELKHHFSVRYDLSVRQSSTSYVELLHRIAPARCDPAITTGIRAPLWRVTLVPAGAKRFAVIMSACHVLLDARGLYTLAGMVFGALPVQQLQSKRNPDVFPRIPQTAGLTHSFDLLSALNNPALPTITAMFSRLVQGGARGLVTGNRSCMAFEVSTDWVNTQKEAAISRGAQFVSTNDVVTSELLKLSACDMGLMAVDLRGRVAESNEKQMGNYLMVMYYSPADYALPENIRSSLDGKLPQSIGIPKSSLRSAWQHTSQGRYAIVTNWSTFAHSPNIKDATAELHVGLMDCPVSNVASYMILFETAPGKLGVALYAVEDILDEARKSSMFDRILEIPV